MKINKNTKKIISIAERPGTFGVDFHNRGYELLGLNYMYIPLKVLPHELHTAMSLVRGNFAGCSVSMPYKEDVIKYLDELDGTARAINAVNTIVNSDGRLTGYNTDYLGVRKVIGDSLDIFGKEVVLIGAGGVAQAIGLAVKELGGDLNISNRNRTKAEDLAEKVGARTFPFERITNSRGHLLINATSVGMGSDESIVDEKTIRNFDAVMDVVIGDSRLIKTAKQIGKVVLPGKRMTVYQAAEQFKLYTRRVLPKEFLEKFLDF